MQFSIWLPNLGFSDNVGRHAGTSIFVVSLKRFFIFTINDQPLIKSTLKSFLLPVFGSMPHTSSLNTFRVAKQKIQRLIIINKKYQFGSKNVFFVTGFPVTALPTRRRGTV